MRGFRKSTGYWLLSIAVVTVLMFVVQMWGPNPPVRLSHQTTRITAPLGVDGLPNYQAYLHQQISAGSTPENNAAVLIWKAMWPGGLSPGDELAMCNAMQMEVPDPEASLVPVYRSQVENKLAKRLRDPSFGAGADDFDYDSQAHQLAEQTIDHARERPWTGKQLPELEQWVRANEEPLNWLIEGAARPRFYSPTPSMAKKTTDSLMVMLLPGVQMLRSSARSLSCRAMWHLGSGRTEQAWQDLLACHRIARHTATGVTLVERLVGIAVDVIASQGTQTLLHHGNLSSEEARGILQDLSELPPLPSLTEAIDQGERMMYLDSTMRIATGQWTLDKIQQLAGVNVTRKSNVVAGLSGSTRVDWNMVLSEGNVWYDRMVEASKLPRDQRNLAIQQIEAEIQELGVAPQLSPAKSLLRYKTRSRLIANLMVRAFIPAIGGICEASDRSQVVTDMTRVAAGLAVYRAEHAGYPERLQDLVPSVLPEVPLDVYSGNPLIYRRQNNGYLLYSVFRNGVDDGGTDIDRHIVKGRWTEDSDGVDLNQSDLVLLVPRPALEVPKSLPALDE